MAGIGKKIAVGGIVMAVLFGSNVVLAGECWSDNGSRLVRLSSRSDLPACVTRSKWNQDIIYVYVPGSVGVDNVLTEYDAIPSRSSVYDRAQLIILNGTVR